MRPPFGTEEFFDVFARYHEWMWPAPLVLFALGVGLVGFAAFAPRHSRIVAGGLAALWVWMAVMYHAAFFSFLTPMAYVFAALFLVQAALLAWHGLVTRRLHFAPSIDRTSRVVGAALATYGLLGYPLLAYLAGQRYPAMPTFGLPCPTTILTFALLAWCVRPVPRSVLVVPVAWALVATMGALSFGVVEDFALPLAAVATLLVLRHSPVHGAESARRAGRLVQIGF